MMLFCTYNIYYEYNINEQDHDFIFNLLIIELFFQ